MPYIAATFPLAPCPGVGTDVDASDDFLCCGYLIGTHHKQQILRGEYTIAGEDIENGVFREKSLCKVNEVKNRLVVFPCPVGCELKRIGSLFLSLSFARALVASCHSVTRGIAVIFGECAVADNEYLDELKQSATGPERITLIAVDLVESVFDADPILLFIN